MDNGSSIPFVLHRTLDCSENEADKTLFLIVSTMILFNSIGMEWLYKGLEEYSYITIRSIIVKVISVGAMFLLVKSKEDYVIYGGISIFASSASNVLNL